MGTVLLCNTTQHAGSGGCSFSPLLDGDGVAFSIWDRLSGHRSGVSVPFSMGTVLLCLHGCDIESGLIVSVPFSMGTVLLCSSTTVNGQTCTLFQSPSRWGRCCFVREDTVQRHDIQRFSPLLDGDGVAFPRPTARGLRRTQVSVPFSMGTVLLFSARTAGCSAAIAFQSPSRWGRCCFMEITSFAKHALRVSVPFSMGTVLLWC